ncbi:MAG: hypothetical protein QNI84_02455 [Henriciella sp.]|nr:hypothetical protein [Henriciella sp.]
MKSNIVDAPDGGRKTQEKPVARLGGVAIAASATISFILTLFTLGSLAAYPVSVSVDSIHVLVANHTSLFAFCVTAFLIGLWDDIRTAGTKLKLVLFVVSALAGAGFGLRSETLTSPFGDLTTPSLLLVGSALWLIVFTNAANFMDGSNGLAIGCLAIMLGGLAIAGHAAGDAEHTLWWFVLFGAIGGFLVHNLRGNLYAGDAGALGLGALFASLGLVSGLEVWTVATLALPFLVDVLLTLIWRANHGRSWLSPHRDHAYQRLMDQGWGHLDVAILYWGLSAVCAVSAIIAASSGGWIPFTLFWVLLLAGCILWCVGRSTIRPDKVG